MPTYTSEELAQMAVVSNTEAAFENISDTIVPANTIYYSVDTNMARVGDGATTWGALVPFLYGEDLNVNVVQKITGSWQGIALPSEDTVPSTLAVDEALSGLKSEINTSITTVQTNLNKTISDNEAEAAKKFKSIDTNIDKLSALSTNISGVSERLSKVEDNLKPNSVNSIVYEVKTDIKDLENELTQLESTVKNNIQPITNKMEFPLPISKGGTGATNNTQLESVIAGLGFQKATSGSSSTATTAQKLAKAQTIKVYTYTTGAGNIVSSKLYNMSGSQSFDGSGPVNIAMLAATYTNCNCKCDDDY